VLDILLSELQPYLVAQEDRVLAFEELVHVAVDLRQEGFSGQLVEVKQLLLTSLSTDLIHEAFPHFEHAVSGAAWQRVIESREIVTHALRLEVGRAQVGQDLGLPHDLFELLRVRHSLLFLDKLIKFDFVPVVEELFDVEGVHWLPLHLALHPAGTVVVVDLRVVIQLFVELAVFLGLGVGHFFDVIQFLEFNLLPELFFELLITVLAVLSYFTSLSLLLFVSEHFLDLGLG